jgi:hypothetical protein
MFFTQADHRDPKSLASRMRRKRTGLLIELLSPFGEPVRILDVGGLAMFWRDNCPQLPKRCNITMLNVTETATEGLPNIESVVGDARRMTMFADDSFDIVFSNSVIEHVGTLYDQMAMAKEVERVGKAYFVQTPNRYFPLEPHFLFPFWTFMPTFLRSRLLQHFNLGWIQREPNLLQSRARIEQMRLLNFTEMKGLFPNAKIVGERIGPLIKSLIAVRRSADSV